MKKTISIILFLFFVLVGCNAQKNPDLKSFKSYNNIEYKYQVILPENYLASKQYELAMVFSELGSGENAWQPTVEVISSIKANKNTIFIVPKVPTGEKHWETHPIHHGLNDLMDFLRKTYGHDHQRFHFLGHKKGHDVAFTYSLMSKAYVSSLTVIQSSIWDTVEQDWLDDLAKAKIPFFIYEKSADAFQVDISKAVFVKNQTFASGIKYFIKRFEQQ